MFKKLEKEIVNVRRACIKTVNFPNLKTKLLLTSTCCLNPGIQNVYVNVLVPQTVFKFM